MIRRRLPALFLQLLIAAQSAIFVTVAPGTPAAPAVLPPPQLVRAAGGCQVTTGTAGAGTVSACPDAQSYADVANALKLALDQARSAVATGSLHVTSSPDGATVLVNGQETGRTPLETPVRAGSYLVRVTKDGFAPFSTMVSVSADRPGDVAATLEAAPGSAGSYNWVRPETLTSLASGFPEGTFDITSYVRGEDGADYVAFVNTKKVTVEFDEPTEMSGSGKWLKSEDDSISMVGVARSTDDGATWQVIRTWTGSYFARTWTSERFYDNEWNNGDPGTITQHWIRAYYHEERQERYVVTALIPLPDGGVSAYVTHLVFHQPQELMLIWDNLPDDYCRADDDINDCARIDHPGRYIGSIHAPFTKSLVSALGSQSEKYKSVASPDATARFGVLPLDLATYILVRERSTTALNTSSLSEPTVTGFDGLTYQGSHEGDDYFLAIVPDCCSTDGSVYVARDGGQPALVTTYNLGEGAPKGSSRFEEVRIAPDGSLYLLDHVRGGIYQLGSSGAELLGTVDPSIYGGLYGPDYPAFNYLSAAIDAGGNLHVAFRVAELNDKGDPKRMKVFYEVFMRDKVTYDGVALFTAANCAPCDTVRDWLTKAGVTFRENPTDLPAALATSVAAQEASAGLPVIARLGSDAVALGGVEPAAVSRLLGVPYPVLIDTHAVRAGRTADHRLIGYQPDWALLVLEDDQPRVITQRDEGVVAFAPAPGSWTSTLVLSTPPPAAVFEYETPDGTATAFDPRYPIFPGGLATPYVATARDVPFNTITKVSDLRFLFRSGSGGEIGRFGYTLHTTKAAPTSSTYTAAAQASQLIPAATFDIALGAEGSASEVRGELAAYVTSQAVVEDDGDRFYHVVVDLRAQNETATNGTILERVIGGSVTVQTEVDGNPETREINLGLTVANARLRVSDPSVPGAARDLSAEAVHFAGQDERWLVTSNLAIPNSIPCGPDQALLLDPFSVSAFTAAQVKSFEMGSCLDALEVAPTVATGCESWEDAKLVLAADTIDALAQSLPLSRSEGVTNYEQAFGTTSATVNRIVGLDTAPPIGGGPRCASEVDLKPAAVVRIEGRILGEDEAYQPTVTVVDQGAAEVRTASAAQPSRLAWERDWLELESTFLEASLHTAIADDSLAAVMVLERTGKRVAYQRQLLAARALLQCNSEGHDLAEVLLLMQRNASIPESIRGAVKCLQDFVTDPSRNWPTYDRSLWAGGAYETAFLGTIINSGLSSNPTLAFIAEAAKGKPVDYGQFVIGRGQALEARAGSGGENNNLAYDFALDHYARVATAASRELGGAVGGITRALLLASEVERLSVRFVADCVRAAGSPNPFPDLIKKTASRSYQAGIACVDNAGAGNLKIDAYRRLGYGLRSGTFAAMFEAAGRDLDLLSAYLGLVPGAIDTIHAAEAKYPAGTGVDAYAPSLSPVERLTIAERHVGALLEARGHRLTVTEAAQILKGVVECGVGLVKGVFTEEGISLLLLGIEAAVAGPFAAAAGGVIFLGSGVLFTGLAASDLAQAWESLDLTGKTAGLCGTVASALMTVASARPTTQAVTRAVAELRANPPKVIRIRSLPNRGKSAGQPLPEQAKALKPRGKDVAPPREQAVRPVPADLETILAGLDAGRAGQIRALAADLGFDAMTAGDRAMFAELSRLYGTEEGVGAVLRGRKEGLDRVFAASIGADSVTAEVAAGLHTWSDLAAAFALELLPGRPRSLRVSIGPQGVAGSDAPLVKAILGDGWQPNRAAAAERGISTEQWRASGSLLEAYLDSPRLAAELATPTGARALFSAEEVQFLLGMQKAARPTGTFQFVRELGLPTLLATVQEGVANARALNGVPITAQLSGVEAEYLAAGVFKTAYRMKLHFADGRTLDLVVKKGAYGQGEFQLLKELGDKGLTQRPYLDGLVQGIDGVETEFLGVEEFIDGKTLKTFSNDPQEAAALGAFDARLFLRTLRGEGADARAYYNKDLHMDNMKVYEVDGTLVAKAVDFDPRFKRDLPPDLYFGATFMRRQLHVNFAVFNDTYFQGFLDAFAAEPGHTRAQGVAIMREAAANIGKLEFEKRVVEVQSLRAFPTDEALQSASAEVVKRINGFLATQP